MAKDTLASDAASLRRKVVVGLAASIGMAATGGAAAQMPGMKPVPATEANKSRTALRYTIEFAVAPQRVFDALTDSAQFAKLTGAPAKIDGKDGDAFSLFGGLIVGRNIELVPGKRVVQAWRPTHWDAGIYSIVHFELAPQGKGTLLTLDHIGFPAGEADSLDKGWHEHYIETMKKYLA